MSSFFSYLINGISLGSIYAIIALGYTMVYGIAKMLNFAHGDVIMVGSYMAFLAMGSLGLPPVVAVLLAVVVCTILGITIEKIAYKPLRKAPSLAVLITAIGVSYFLQNTALLVFGANTKMFTSVIKLPPVILGDGGVNISGETQVAIVVCIIIMIVLTTFIKKTKAGQAMLAVSEDKGAAELMGVNVNGTISLTLHLVLIPAPCRESRPLWQPYLEESDPSPEPLSEEFYWELSKICPRPIFPPNCLMPLYLPC